MSRELEQMGLAKVTDEDRRNIVENYDRNLKVK